MSHHSDSISNALDVSDTLAAGQVIKFAEGVALSGIASASLGPALVVIDPDTGEEKSWLYLNGDIGFGGVDDRTSFRNNSGVQVDAYYGPTRVFYYNGNGLNMSEKTVQGERRRVSSRTVDTSPNSQDTKIVYNNSGAAGLVTFTLSQLVTGGHQYTFIRTADFPVRIVPTDEAILMPTGLLPVGNYIELGNLGASVTLLADAGGTWMTLNQQGTVTAQ